jgi:nucleotide-binding universal stress UspA family protein
MSIVTAAIPARFLVAVDGSAHASTALGWVAGLARAGVSLHCVVLNAQRPLMSGEVSVIAPASLSLGEREHNARGILEQAVRILNEAGIASHPEHKLDDPVDAILDSATAHECDAIVLGRRGQGVLRSALLGSVSSEAVRRSPLPVIVVNETLAPPEPGPLAILVALDGSAAAERAARFTTRLAQASAGAMIHLLHVQPTMTVAEAVLGPRDQLLDHWSGSGAERAFDKVRRMLAESALPWQEHTKPGHEPGDAIALAAADLRCSLIAMGTRGLGPLAGRLLGSAALRVIEHAGVPVALSC